VFGWLAWGPTMSFAGPDSADRHEMASWQPVLGLGRDHGTDHWAGFLADELWTGDRQQAKRRVEAATPTGLLPLLERPRAMVEADIAEWERAGSRPPGFLTRRLPLESLILHALTSTQDYWAGLALAWAAEVPPTPGPSRRSVTWRKAPWASHAVRHGARRVRRMLTAPDAARGPGPARPLDD
jgi:hypothetical protein